MRLSSDAFSSSPCGPCPRGGSFCKNREAPDFRPWGSSPPSRATVSLQNEHFDRPAMALQFFSRACLRGSLRMAFDKATSSNLRLDPDRLEPGPEPGHGETAERSRLSGIHQSGHAATPVVEGQYLLLGFRVLVDVDLSVGKVEGSQRLFEGFAVPAPRGRVEDQHSLPRGLYGLGYGLDQFFLALVGRSQVDVGLV